MKRHNQHRGENHDKVRHLESRFSYWQRLKDVCTSRRGLHRLRLYALYLAGVVILCCAVNEVYTRLVQKTYSAHIEHIKYQSKGIVEQSHAIHILGLTTESTFASLDCEAMKQELEASPLIASAKVLKERPNTLVIHVTERLPLAYVKMERDVGQVNPPAALFMDDTGTLFPVVKEQHTPFLNSPTWYLKTADLTTFKVGARIKESSYKPIVELLSEVNRYSLTEIPLIKSIQCPKAWKITLSLETGTEVLMKNSNLAAQVKRLSQILEHARSTDRQVRSANVIPDKNPAVRFF
ncbi:MAG: FtsQ-type POTRA domain-containing protein [Akkermansia sp.]